MSGTLVPLCININISRTIMKLHLPKLLCAAVMAAFTSTVFGAELTINTNEAGNTMWNVGGGDINARPAENVIVYNDDITLNSGDKLGYFNDKGDIVSYDNGDGATMHLVTFKLPVVNPETGKTTYQTVGTETQYISGNKEFSNILDVKGTLSINGTASVQLGGQYKVQKRTDYVDENGNVTKQNSPSSYLDDYSGLRADNVVVNGTGAGTHLHSTSALIGNLTVNSGNVTLHTDQYSGNGTWQAFYNDGTSFKVAQIEQSLTQNGGSINMGRTKSDHSNTTNSHINNVFGTSSTAATITQTNGSLNVFGYSYARTGMTISQENGSIIFRDVLLFDTNGSNTIKQTGNGTMEFGRLDSANTSKKVDFDITQSGSGTIKLTGGTKLGRVKIDGVYVNSLVNITQSGNGSIIIGGGNGITASNYPIKNFSNQYTTYNIEQTGKGSITINSDAAITANDVTVGEGSTINVYGGMTVNGTTTVAGTIDVKANASLTLNGIVNVEGKGTILGNMILGNTTTLNFETTANMAISSTLSLTEGNSMSFHIDTVTDEDGFMQMSESGDLNFTAGTLSLNLTDVAKQEMVAGATLEGTEFHLTLIDNLSAADVAELEGVINSSLLLEEYLEELPLTLSRAVAPTVTLEAQGLLLENNQLKAVVVATSHNVPEPTTATLSLLALAGLAARRRRR